MVFVTLGAALLADTRKRDLEHLRLILQYLEEGRVGTSSPDSSSPTATQQASQRIRSPTLQDSLARVSVGILVVLTAALLASRTLGHSFLWF
jgi:hypothetical protein